MSLARHFGGLFGAGWELPRLLDVGVDVGVVETLSSRSCISLWAECSSNKVLEASPMICGIRDLRLVPSLGDYDISE